MATDSTNTVNITDEDIKKELWKGLLPIVFELTPNEITTLQPPSPYYVLAPRNSYFPIVTTNVRKHFQAAAPTIGGEIWFEYKSKPLKWHYPVGVLYDVFCNEFELPWSLVVHFQGFPTDQLLRCANEEAVKWHYINMIKEATYIKHGDCAKVNSLSVQESNDLWDGLKNNDYTQFWKSNGKLSAEPQTQKGIPTRMFLHNHPACVQECVGPHDKGTVRTLSSFLNEFASQVFTANNIPSTTNYKVLVQGMSPPLDVPLSWLCEHFGHPDNFLYMVIVPL